MIKKLTTTVAACAAMSLALAACGGGSSSAGSSGGSSGSGSTATVDIGFLGNLTGAAATIGVPVGNALKLAFDQANATKAVPGVTFKLSTADTQTQVPNAVTAFQKFAQDGAEVTISDALTPIASAIAPLADQQKVMFLTGAGGNHFNNANGMIWQWTDFVGPLKATAAQLYKLGARKAVVLVDSDNPAFVAEGATAGDAFGKLGGQVLGTEKFAQSDTNFSSQLTNIASMKPDSIVVSGLEQQSGNIVKQIRQTPGLSDVQIAGPIGWDEGLAKTSGNDAAKGIIFPSYWADGTDANASAFSSAYKKAYNAQPTAFAAMGYEMAWLIVAASDAAKSAGKELSSTTIRDQFPGATSSELAKKHGVVTDIKITKDGGITYPGAVVQFQADGTVKPLS